jgi:hypothetical protein
VKASARLRALMQSALLLLINVSACTALDHVRVWRSQSDRSCHQFKCTPGSVSEGRCSSRPPTSLYDGLDAILVVVREERPGHLGVLMGSGDGRAVFAASGDERFEPPTPIVLLRVDPAQRGSGAVHEELTPIAVAACAAPEEPWLAPRRGFPGDQPGARPRTGGRA